MTVKQLKQLLKQTPLGLTKKEFNSLEVVLGTENGDFVEPCGIDSGLVELGLCDACLAAIEDGDQPKCEPEIVFGLVPCGFYTNQTSQNA